MSEGLSCGVRPVVRKTLAAGEEVRTELYFPHGDESLTFVHPYAGPGAFVDVMNELSKAGLKGPTAEQTAFLVDFFYDTGSHGSIYAKEIVGLMNVKWLWMDNSLLWTPEGAYIENNPKIEGSRVYRMDESSLRERLESGDKKVRFVPHGFKLGEQSPSELEKNEFVRALAGDEGAEKLARVAGKHGGGKAYVSAFSPVERPIQRVAALGSSWSFSGHELEITIDHGLGNTRVGYALGLSY